MPTRPSPNLFLWNLYKYRCRAPFSEGGHSFEPNLLRPTFALSAHLAVVPLASGARMVSEAAIFFWLGPVRYPITSPGEHTALKTWAHVRMGAPNMAVVPFFRPQNGGLPLGPFGFPLKNPTRTGCPQQKPSNPPSPTRTRLPNLRALWPSKLSPADPAQGKPKAAAPTPLAQSTPWAQHRFSAQGHGPCAMSSENLHL